MSVAVILYNWQEWIIGTQVELFFHFSICNAEHDVLLNVNVDLNLCKWVLLDAYLASNYYSLIVLSSSFLCMLFLVHISSSTDQPDGQIALIVNVLLLLGYYSNWTFGFLPWGGCRWLFFRSIDIWLFLIKARINLEKVLSEGPFMVSIEKGGLVKYKGVMLLLKGISICGMIIVERGVRTNEWVLCQISIFSHVERRHRLIIDSPFTYLLVVESCHWYNLWRLPSFS